MTAKIIDFHQQRQLLTVVSTRTSVAPCSCTRFVIDTYTRDVLCRHCGKCHDPFFALLRLANETTRYTDELRSLQKEIEEKKQELMDLKSKHVEGYSIEESSVSISIESVKFSL